MSTEVHTAARAWRDQDPDPQTRGELDALLSSAESGDTAAESALTALFAGRLDFGTAGLRGELGPGPLRMNRVLVAQAAAGLAEFLRGRDAHPSVVIGYDGRRNSEVFARDTAEIMQGAGIAAILLPRLLPTPVLAYAVRTLNASGGVMVTASHNPARDNGYKVYLGGEDGGSQIVAPADAAIRAEIVRVAEGTIASLPRSTEYRLADESLIDGYVAQTAAAATSVSPLRYVYTPLHGVGLETATRVFRAAGYADPIVVPEQAEPDSAFPTVAFPNPEEPGAMDLALALAASIDADLVIANDPDADRVAVAVPVVSTGSTGGAGWQALSGNEVGWLLGWRTARQLAARGERGTLACSLVSSPALAAVAAASGLDFVETLTGFKWISRAPELAFGYEEALGYLVDPDKVRDKDGISAAVAVLSLFSELRETGVTLDEHRAAFAELFGGFASAQISIRVAELAEIPRAMSRLRAEPPSEIGGLRVTAFDDFLDGIDDFAPTDILRFRIEPSAGVSGRVIVRPSGTEPKLKCYLDASSLDGSAAARLAEAKRIVAVLDAGMREILGR
ncbi:MAG TPA: phospho-sugar mutase [Pseudolysinimonas sp.]|nr:phospho-sugar mutase [Pseudolysinimonas sp.]